MTPPNPQPHISWMFKAPQGRSDQLRWSQRDLPRRAGPSITAPTPELIRTRMRTLRRDQRLLCWWIPTLLSAVALFNFIAGLSENKSPTVLAWLVVGSYCVCWSFALIVQPLAIKVCWGIPWAEPLRKGAARKIAELEAGQG